MPITNLYPHEVVDINDKSYLTVQNTTVGDSDGPTLLACGITEKGPDGVLVDLNPGDFSSEFGEIDFLKQGQTNLDVKRWLAAGGNVKFMRLTADDATFANSIVYAEVATSEVQKENSDNEPLYLDADGNETTVMTDNTAIMITKADVKVTTESVASASGISTISNLLDTTTFTDDGTYTKYPLFAIVSKGRGEYGNSISHRLTWSDVDGANCPVWTLDVMTTSNRGKTTSIASEIGLDPRGVLNSLPVYGRIVVGNNSEIDVDFLGSNAGISAVRDIMLECAVSSGVDVTQIDYLTGATNDLQCINVESTVLTSNFGISLANGSDGSWGTLDWSTGTQATKFADFYSGSLDGSILDASNQKIDYVLDHNYPSEVKMGLVSFANGRNDVKVYLDAGVQTTATAVKDAALGLGVSFNNRCQLFGQSAEVVDPYISQYITVTGTYFLASKIPVHVNGPGYHEPIAGPDFGVINTSSKLIPEVVTDADKNALYATGILYACMENGKTVIQHEQTLQSEKSKLSKGSNVEILNRIVKKCHEIGPASRFETARGDDLDNIVKDTNDALTEFENYTDYINFEVTQTDRQKQLNILERKIQVIFPDRNERGLFTIDVIRQVGGDQ